MIRFGTLLLLFTVLTSACGTAPTPVASTATFAPKRVTQVPTFPVTFIPQEDPDIPELSNSALVDFYDPARNPAQDLQQAILIAQNQNKRIMLELGGDWCIWCKYMDEFYASHPEILQLRADNYVLIKVNVSEENMNEAFLSQYPAAAGYPHIYILEQDGTFLHSQDTVELEDGADSYVPEVFTAFLEKWAPAK